ncbi:aldehyde dehydrogenase family protein [Chitinophaga pendula]|uniref:aldehyde dehydrogenase family protein n=1 Tax=Chitinophaga TaxID=79328 RepID=UPI000BB06641|nr:MULTISPECIES: aldehyde dehydrogenase family protein [Chitinophaga]ASZ09656.1 aldehyde dehydrogenase family protein [Chitinophaga sp. MD30]UCJ07407.1 aldehyde dehydrogenase family protein [Chitinophaga pendula]
MKIINSVYINGQFLPAYGQETASILSPLNGKAIASLTYANEEDTRAAICAADEALKSYAQSSIPERITYLQSIHDAIMDRMDDLIEATILEYGAPRDRARWANILAATTFTNYIAVLKDYPFERQVNESTVIMEPVGVAALFTPWNATAGSIAVKLAPALAAGCTVILKPSEFTPWQAQIVMEAIHTAALPTGVVNMVNGRGDVIGSAIMESPIVNKISFTGSTVVGKTLARQAVDTMKRVTLELGGKSANIILDDADLNQAIPMALQAAFMNNGQACIAGSRLLVPATKMAAVKAALIAAAPAFVVGNPEYADVNIGPLASQKQFDRVQHYIAAGIAAGAELIYGGPGRPDGLSEGYYVQPTIFFNVHKDMQIAQEEIFGPVLSVIAYHNEAEAVAIANESPYGLMAYISSTNMEKAQKIAAGLKAGRVLINTLKHDPFAPFGGYKESGIGRENGVYGLEEYLEIKTLIA